MIKYWCQQLNSAYRTIWSEFATFGNRPIKELFPITVDYPFFTIDYSLTKKITKFSWLLPNAKLKSSQLVLEAIKINWSFYRGRNLTTRKKFVDFWTSTSLYLTACLLIETVYLTVWTLKYLKPFSRKFTEDGKGKIFSYRVASLTTRLFYIF